MTLYRITTYSPQAWMHRKGLLPGRVLPSIRIADVQRAVCERFGVHPIEMQSHRRSRDVARPRQVAMYLARSLTPQSLPAIGRSFGNRDHTTVIYACRQIEKLIQTDAALAEAVSDVERSLAA